MAESSPRNQWLFTVAISLIGFAAAGGMFYLMIRDMSREAALVERGVQTQATIVECRSNTNSISAQLAFEVAQANGQSQRYEVSYPAFVDCQEGKTVSIHYLPDDPTIILPEGQSNVGLSGCYGVLALSITLYGLWEAYRKWKKAEAALRNGGDQGKLI